MPSLATYLATACVLVLSTLPGGLASSGHATAAPVELSELLSTVSTAEFKEWIVGIRRHLHQWPELSFQEFNTSSFIRSQLDKMGIPYKYPLAKTGILGKIGSGAGPVIALRADIDALPIDEGGLAEELPFVSQVPGVMHACGHDAHVSMLLGAGRLLKQYEASLPGTVLLMFQPAEEAMGGAKSMIEEGALDGVDAVAGVHVWPSLPAGVIASKPGPIMAASDRFEFRVIGRGGHGAIPQESRDPVVAASAIVLALQTLVSRETSPVDGAVVTVARFNTGPGANNVIPEAVDISGTVRALSQDTFERLHRRLEEVGALTAQAYGCKLSEVIWSAVPYPVTRNDVNLAQQVELVANELQKAGGSTGLPPIRSLTLEEPSMAAEDFSFYGHKVPAVLTWLGIKDDKLKVGAGLHNPNFRMNEDVMPLGSAYHTALAMRLMHHMSVSSSKGPTTHSEL